MNLHVLHDARTLARLTGATPPACDALACRLGRPDQIAAAWVEGNPLAPGWIAAADGPGPRLMCWSGSLAEDLQAQHPANWMRPGRAALDALLTQAAPALEAQGRSICLRPHLRHVLSDAQGCLRFLADHAGLLVQIALSPADMISADMLRDLPEHLERLFASLGPRAAVVLLEDIGPMSGDEAPRPCPLGQGALPRERVRRLLAEHVPAGTPVIVGHKDLDAQLAWLGARD
jgi:hypothetical protein